MQLVKIISLLHIILIAMRRYYCVRVEVSMQRLNHTSATVRHVTRTRDRPPRRRQRNNVVDRSADSPDRMSLYYILD